MTSLVAGLGTYFTSTIWLAYMLTGNLFVAVATPFIGILGVVLTVCVLIALEY